MSYDLMVFEPAAAPLDRPGFLDWYRRVTAWEGTHDHSDPANASARLRGWYGDMITRFPAMNGPDAVREGDAAFDTLWVTDYCITANAIYMAFASSVSGYAYDMTRDLAMKHGLGFHDVSGAKGAVWLPSGASYSIAHSEDGAEPEEDAVAAPKGGLAQLLGFFRRT